MQSYDEVPPIEGFEIIERIGRGGAAKVYLARSPAGRLVAVKVLRERDEEGDDDDGSALSREASMCVRLNHPAIVQLRSFIDHDGVSALVFEYVRGVALGRILRLCQSRGVRLPDDAAWHIVERVLSALAYAHAQTDETHAPSPIVHRDVSPSNVLVDWEGEVKLGDFGLAKMVGRSGVTQLGVVKGTLGCMAPEQARGEEVTQRADVYAAGLLAWRLATGRAPFARFKDDEMEMIRAFRNPRIKPLALLRPDLPAPLLDAVAAALEPDASKRELTAESFARLVREQFDTETGKEELTLLLGAWRDALERSVAKSTTRSGVASRPSEEESGVLSGEQSLDTMRYEEVALAFDEPEAWGPDEALPSDARIQVSLPVDVKVESSRDSSPTSARGHDSIPVPPPASIPPKALPAAPVPDAAARGSDPRAVALVLAGVGFVLLLLYWLGSAR